VLRCCSPPHVHPASEYVSGLTEGRPSASDYLVKPLGPIWRSRTGECLGEAEALRP
jgi:hypothetical protein